MIDSRKLNTVAWVVELMYLRVVSVNSNCALLLPGNRGAFTRLGGHGDGAFANFAGPGGRALANVGGTPRGFDTHVVISLKHGEFRWSR